MKQLDAILVRDLRLWAHVGVLEHERRDGQWFSVDLTLNLDLSRAAVDDDLSASLDYSTSIKALQQLAAEIRCLTIEHFSEQMLNRLETLHGRADLASAHQMRRACAGIHRAGCCGTATPWWGTPAP